MFKGRTKLWLTKFTPQGVIKYVLIKTSTV